MDNPTCRYLIHVTIVFIACAFFFYTHGQNTSHKIIWDQLISVENSSLSVTEKLNQVLLIKKQFEDRKLAVDSVYARILHRTGLYEYLLNDEVATSNAIAYTQTAIRINSSGKKNNSITFCVNSYTNLALYYKSLHMYDLALLYFDSALILRTQYYVPQITEVSLMFDKVQLLYRTGDYGKAIEEIDVAIVKSRESRDSSRLAGLFNQRAQSNLMQGRIEEALKDVTSAGAISKPSDNSVEEINNMLLKADILAKKSEYSKAIALYQKGINSRIQTKDYVRIANDYTDFGNFFLNDLRDYSRAKECYRKVIKYALNGNYFEGLSKAHINLELCSFGQQNYEEAMFYCTEALKDLKLNSGDNNILINPSAGQLSSVSNKDLILTILGNKTELLLAIYKQTKDTNYLSACLRTTTLTDTIITNTRHEQFGEQSKLYWRNKTREFFSNAMEASYLAKEVQLAFYFMEKSRAVLLNDKLNEIGASAHLPQGEAAIEQGFQIAAISEQQKLNSLKVNDSGYEDQLSKLALARANQEHYVKSLEKKYPIYYQYKYADEIVTLDEFRKYLSEKNQSFVHYFMNDTLVYIISITPAGTKMIKHFKNDFNSQQLAEFLYLNSDQSGLNNQYTNFASLSYTLYRLLFQPLDIPIGRVIICPDNFAIPFEALCTDSSGDNFLVSNYIFSYVYSARFLMTKYSLYEPKGNFIGLAPVTFNSYSDIASLVPSAEALKRSASYYDSKVLLTKGSASRHNFLYLAPRYTIVNVFSHALADTTGNEPVLYMYDSVISLSELQLIQLPATKLVVLSACQTVAGRTLKGEGILSLARGFASVGIPSVVATLWQADEQTIYEISERFHEYMSRGLPKDEALQKAKLYFLKNCDRDRRLPFYWANIIVVGNADSLTLASNSYTGQRIGYIFLAAVFVFIIFYYLRKRLP